MTHGWFFCAECGVFCFFTLRFISTVRTNTHKIMKDWITAKIAASQAIDFSGPEKVLTEAIFEKISESNLHKGRYLAAAFDLLMTAEYYKSVTVKNWHYCPNDNPKIYYSFLNACPYCCLKQKFVFTLGNKPQSGAIGRSSTFILSLVLDSYFQRTKTKIEIKKSVEPVDLVLVDESNKQVFAAEVKSAPLTILPLFAETDELTAMEEGVITKVNAHEPISNTHFSSLPVSVGLPKSVAGKWEFEFFKLEGLKNDKNWPYFEIAKLVRTTDFWEQYVRYWVASYETYKHRRRETLIYWFSNACGSPQAVSGDWPDRRNGGGKESISDSKTSVGMDRTDDIKKGIYQVLKVGADGKPFSKEYSLSVGIISNLDAARHFDEYLQNIQNVVWTLDPTGSAKKIRDLPPEQEVYNLFDGIVTFTKNIGRNEWLKQTFQFQDDF